MAINSTNFKFNTPDNGTEEDTWGVKLNENWNKIDALLQGTSYTDTDSNTVEKIRPDLLGGSWAIDNTAVTSSAAELNKLDGVTASTAELNYIVGATSSLQTQLNGKQAVDAGLTSISGLTTAANNMIYTTGSDTYAATSLTAAGRALLDDADAAAQRTTLGLGSAATTASTAYATSTQGSTADTALQPSDNISELTNDSNYITGNQTITLSGDVSGSGTTTITTNIEANKVGVNELNLSEGTSGQFLKTDGSGTISFADVPTQATTFSTIDVDNIKIDGNTISNTDSTSGIILAPNGNDDVTVDFNTDGTGAFVLTTTNTLTFPPKMEFFKNTSSPATIDKIGQLDFYGKDAGGATRAYGSMSVTSTKVDSGASEGTFIFTSYVNNIGTTALRITDGAMTSTFPVTAPTVVLSGGFEPTYLRYDMDNSGALDIFDNGGYYDFDLAANTGGPLVESGMVLDTSWVGDTNATNDNCRFGLSIAQGNLVDLAVTRGGTGTVVGYGDSVAFGNLQHDSNGDTQLINGLAIVGNIIRLGHSGTGTIQLKGTTDVNGDLSVGGALSKNSGSFKIDHPLESKTATHHLVHSFVESPTADNIYRGKVALVSGSATVNIDTVAGMTDGTFAALNRELQCFTSNESGWTAVKGTVSGNTLTITAQEDTCTDTVSWLVVGERKDAHMYDTGWTDDNGKVIVEPEKEA